MLTKFRIMNNIISSSLKNSYSYKEYRELITNLLNQGKSTSENDSDSLVDYTKLNESRMNRIDKKLELTDNIINQVKNQKSKQTWLVISEGWCGDAAQNIPVINKIAELSDNVDLRIVLRDKNLDLMSNFLTNGGQAIPKLIALDDNSNVIDTWGPRPSVATNMVKEYKTAHGKIDAEFKKNLQLWYNKDKGQSLSEDFIKILD